MSLGRLTERHDGSQQKRGEQDRAHRQQERPKCKLHIERNGPMTLPRDNPHLAQIRSAFRADRSLDPADAISTCAAERFRGLGLSYVSFLSRRDGEHPRHSNRHSGRLLDKLAVHELLHAPPYRRSSWTGRRIRACLGRVRRLPRLSIPSEFLSPAAIRAIPKLAAAARSRDMRKWAIR